MNIGGVKKPGAINMNISGPKKPVVAPIKISLGGQVCIPIVSFFHEKDNAKLYEHLQTFI